MLILLSVVTGNYKIWKKRRKSNKFNRLQIELFLHSNISSWNAEPSNFSFVHVYTQGILTGFYSIFQKFCSLKKTTEHCFYINVLYLQDILLTIIFRNICAGLTFIISWQHLAFYRTKLSYFWANTTTHVHL